MNCQSIAPEVVELRLIRGNGPVKAFADVKIGDWTLNDWRVIKREGQPVFVQLPQVSWRDREGKVKYRSLLSIPGELKRRIEVAILATWEKEMSNEHLQG